MKNETSCEAAYAPKIGELVTIRDEVDKTDKGSPLNITLRYVAAGMREGYRQARAGYTPPTGELQELIKALEWYGFQMVADSLNEGRTEISTELGKRARQALASFREVPKPQPSAELLKARRYYENTWPEQLYSGVMFFEGQRITKAEFEVPKSQPHVTQTVVSHDTSSSVTSQDLCHTPKPQPPASDAEELAETCDRLDLAHENEKLREVLEKIAATDTSPSVPDFLWLQRWRNETKDAASKALKGEK